MSSSQKDVSGEEMIITVLSRQLSDASVCLTGLSSMIPILSIGLARSTHAPDLTWISGAVGVDPEVDRLDTGFTMQPDLWRGSTAYLGQTEQFWPMVQRRETVNTFMISGAQVDQYGNVNSSLIGEYGDRKVCMMGSAGMGDMGALGPPTYIWLTHHTPRTLVPAVDFISCPGYFDGGSEREDRGLPGGPVMLVTNRAVFDFEPETHKLRLQSVHPGHDREEVLDQTGFEPVVPGDVSTTDPPGEENLTRIREMDPDEYRTMPR